MLKSGDIVLVNDSYFDNIINLKNKLLIVLDPNGQIVDLLIIQL